MELTCLDGHKQKKNITVPLDCACAQGECSENIGGLTFSARLGGIKATQ